MLSKHYFYRYHGGTIEFHSGCHGWSFGSGQNGNRKRTTATLKTGDAYPSFKLGGLSLISLVVFHNSSRRWCCFQIEFVKPVCEGVKKVIRLVKFWKKVNNVSGLN